MKLDFYESAHNKVPVSFHKIKSNTSLNINRVLQTIKTKINLI